MFFFSKAKPILKDLIEDYVDIHSHLLPGIDDGSKDFDNTLGLINSLLDIGFRQFTATPHIIKNIWDNDRISIENAAASTVEKLHEVNLNVPFKAAAEYMMDESFSKLVASEPLLAIKDNFVLVEMSYINPPMQLYDILFEVRIAGYQPVLAHPERYLFYHNNFEEYKKLKKAGCLFQINLLSSVGYYGKNVAKTAQLLLEKGMIDFTGSDVHHENHTKSFNRKLEIADSKSLKEASRRNDFFKV
ncbi:MAG TPA: CpsB/CapC family capsule biosynthesis tyrosine phosphatase [Flavobacterium sp.]|nr:CpsB/CapC family capsule biosynthesis tyrosine phosphatase [Flavobacterium sp.]